MEIKPRDFWWEVCREREWQQAHFGNMDATVSRLWDAWRASVEDHPDLKLMDGRFRLDEAVPSRATVALLSECLRLHGEDRILDALSGSFYWASVGGANKLPLLGSILRPLVPSDVADPCGAVADWRLSLYPPEGTIACTGSRHERVLDGRRQTFGRCPVALQREADLKRTTPATDAPVDQRFATWTGTGNADAFRAAQAFAAGEGKTLILWGPVGTGKTHLGRSVLHEVKARGGFVAETTGAELTHHLRADFDWDAGTKGEARDALRRLMQADVVLLDDIGKGADPSILTPWMHDYFDKRKGRTVLTCNLDPVKSFGDAFSEAVASRALQDAEIVKTTGKDHRRAT